MELTTTAENVVAARPLHRSSVAACCYRNAHWVLSALPLLVLTWVVWRYAVDVPFLDHWEFVPLIGKLYAGQLTFSDLWAQFNEHRIFFPKLLMVCLAWLTHWNIRYETAASVVLGLGIWFVLFGQTRATARALELRDFRWSMPACSLVVFSISQYENWLWGWQLGLLMGVLAALAAILLLANSPFSWRKFSGALLLAFVATFSFANGVLVWPIGLTLLFLLVPRKKVKRLALSIWTANAGLALWLYLRDYQAPAEHPPLSVVVARPLAFASYVFKFLGSTCTQYGNGGIIPDKVLAVFFGAAGLGIFGWAAWNLAQRLGPKRGALAPYLAMCAYSLGTALLTATARAGFGTNQSLCSRYCSLTAPLWFSVLVLLMLLSHDDLASGQSEARRVERDSFGQVRLARWLLFGSVGLLALSSGFAIRSARELSGNLANGRRFLLALEATPDPKRSHEELFVLFLSPHTVVDRCSVLRTNRLSVFRDSLGAPASRRPVPDG